MFIRFSIASAHVKGTFIFIEEAPRMSSLQHGMLDDWALEMKPIVCHAIFKHLSDFN